MLTSNTPERRRARCEDCDEPVDTEAPGVAQFVEGWAVNRSAGGANAIALRTPHLRWLCRFCLDTRRRGGNPDQGALL